MWLLIGAGGLAGGFVPSLLGADYLSIWGIIGSGIGAFVGLWLYRRMDI